MRCCHCIIARPASSDCAASMALSPRASFLLLLSISFCFSSCLDIEEDMNVFAPARGRNLANDSLVCGAINCVKGQCIDSAIFPFYKCQCAEGWQSPFNFSWIPCVVPNCSIDLGCSGSSNSSTPSPSPPSNNTFNICSFPVCGNGDCIPVGSSLLAYECKCKPGSSNIFNSSSGYCIEQCSLGAGCSNLNLTLGGSLFPSPPPPPAGSQNSSQGIRQTYMSSFIIICGLIVLQVVWFS